MAYKKSAKLKDMNRLRAKYDTVRRVFRKKLALTVLSLAALVTLGIWLDPTRVVWGWLRGEAFYKGRPTSYWSALLDKFEVAPEEENELPSGDGGGYLFYRGPLERWFPSLFPEPDLPSFNLSAKDVLLELTRDPSERVRRCARHALNQLRWMPQ
ncbi:MAG: hypothetical protein HY040_16120 [Planctomycetes bacterium]|nr:hypothetical protein [Planctomycetota bacterium]